MTKEWEKAKNHKFEINQKEETSMKAVGYVSGMYVDYEGNVVDKEMQKKSIRKYASENGIELTAIFEDMSECEKVLDRPGVKNMIGEDGAEMVLVDRVWSLGRTRAAVTPFMRALDSRGMRLEACTDCFDVTSQFTRFWYRQPGKQAYAIAQQVRRMEAPSVTVGA